MTRRLAPAGALLIVAALWAQSPAPVPPDTLPKDRSVDAVPLGLEARPASPDNPLTPARVALGRKLFCDPILSGDRTVACASCHRPDHGFASPDARPVGV